MAILFERWFLTTNTVRNPSPSLNSSAFNEKKNENFVNRGYPADLLDIAHKKSSNASRHDLHRNAQRDTDESIPVVLSYHPCRLDLPSLLPQG